MQAHDAINKVVEMSFMVAKEYLNDLTTEELMVRPAPQANHIAWQLGHLIAGQQEMMAAIGGTPPELPEGFAEAHTKETTGSDDAGKFCDKDTYLDLMEKMRVATLELVKNTSDAQLDEPGPERMRAYAPTKGDVLLMLGQHWMMHVGQFVTVRRKLDKPIVI